ncbi:MAG: nucleotidyltransferase domain-containing protein [Gracilimonas sp.]|jgi:predicted nucleotidyltransferase|nr:nucleotidyltransferase domain-containing protein [Gracilimonas sp.]
MKLKNINNKKLKKACEEFGVRKLYVFGSVAAGLADEFSDIDFLVEFQRDDFEGAFDQFTGFKRTLEEIYERPIDLYSQKKFRNPVFKEEVDASKSLIYAA